MAAFFSFIRSRFHECKAYWAVKGVQRVIAIAGASGTGKTTIAETSGMSVLSLDAFYRPATEAGLPRWLGDVDWEDPATFDVEAAAVATRSLISSGRTRFRSHDLVTEVSQENERVVVAHGPCLVIEGVMATEVATMLRCELHHLELVFFVLRRNRFTNFVGRIKRDVIDRRRRWPRALLRSLRVLSLEARLQQRAVANGAKVVGRRQLRKKLRAQLRACRSLVVNGDN
jgi:uridine kinase